jgi:gliding motility-associated-like protein
MKKYYFAILVTFLLSVNCYSQFSKTHYIPPVSNTGAGGQDPQGQYLYISSPSLTPISFNILEIGGGSITGTVSRDVPYVHTIGFGYDTQMLIDSGDVGVVKNNKGFIVEAEDLIYVTVRLTSSPSNFQAGGLVSKGIAALGTQFRVGGFLNLNPPSTNQNHYTFATILATENNTTVSFSDIEPGCILINNGSDTLPDIVLNAGESYAIALQGPGNPNRDALIGALIASDKPIAVNCGSFAGSNANSTNLDLGFDQIVSIERTGTEYIFIKGNGFDVTEIPFVIAHEDNTEIFINGNATPVTTLNHGEYFALDGTAFSSNGNLYIRASKNVFAYQAIGSVDGTGGPSLANQNMHFLPPLSCQTPKSIDNIPLINEVGGITDFFGTVCLVTKSGATLDFTINGIDYSLTQLEAAGFTVNGPFAVTGNSDYVTYTVPGLTGNVSVFSSEQVYLSYFGSSGFATYGGFYSGFTFKPEIVFQEVDITQSNCIPNVELKVNTLSGFNTYQWYFNNVEITGATNFNYFPTAPGYYKVRATLTECGLDYFSDEIPVSNCPLDTDNDASNDNVDLDFDNDGMTNCYESFGDLGVNTSNSSAGSISLNTFSNSFTGQVTTSTTATAQPFVGSNDGSFITEVPAGKGYFVKYTMTFNQPQNIKLEYVTTANPTDLINDGGEFIVSSDINQTMTVLNPDNQLLIDTNYDGLYENNVTQFSSFEIRFRLNSNLPLAANTGTFQFLANKANSLSITHKNLTDIQGNKATFRIIASCIPKDSDGDGIPDQADYDSDNDTTPDFIESQGINFNPLSSTDANGDGIDDVFTNGITPADTDNDGIADYLDYDSDNDGIFDINESGSQGSTSSVNGTTNGPNFGSNGLDDAFETSPDNGLLNYTLVDSDADGIPNFLETDSDNDGCIDIIEAGYTDANSDLIVGDETTPTFSSNGVVNSSTGYGIPNNDYLVYAVINITAEPTNVTTCELETATFTLTTDPVDSYQWQLSTDNGTTWTDITNNATYSGSTTVSLTVSNVTPSMVGYQYRVFLNKNGNACGLYSAAATLTTYALPVVTTPVNLVQCDNDTDGISDVNLTVKNDFISANYLNETFTYYTTQLAAETVDTTFEITNPIAYTTNTTVIYVRVENSNGCYRVAQLNVFVSATQIPANTLFPFFSCDDYIDATNNDYDGISQFDFSSVTPAIQGILPATATYTITYYRNEADALAEVNSITDISNFRNIGYPNQHDIWVRVDSNLDNACFGLGPFVRLTVEALPIANPVNTTNIIRNCDDDHDGVFNFDTSAIETTILLGQTNVDVVYTDTNGIVYNPLPNPFPVTNQLSITARVVNNATQASNGPCFDEVTFQFIVDDLPEAFPIPASDLTVCDDETDPADQDGSYNFDTSTLQSQILNGQTGMLVTYTLADGTVLNQLPNPFPTGTQNVIVTVTNPINTSCSATTTLNFVVNPLPNIDIEYEELICINIPTFLVTLDAGITDATNPNDYNYQWSLDGVEILGANSYTLQVNTEGTYTVKVVNSLGCPVIRTIEVIASNAATIDNVIVVDLVDNNTITVTASGLGDYEYALDEGLFQSTGFFDTVSIGIHTVYVRDKNGCGETQQIVHVLGAPKYFTPNGDGIHDTWNIAGISESFNSRSIIYIFDRYGKLIKQISPVGPGWNGTFNGKQMPGDDYWFTVQFEDGRSAKGNFTLKR